MIEKIKQTINAYDLLKKGDRVVVALSGGPDSISLLHILNELKNTYEIELYGAHLNHGLRGIEALKDAQYASQFCEEREIMCFVKSADVAQFAKEQHMSLEEAGRTQRYVFFQEVAEKVRASKIAVAHNLNDQAETLLMRLLRGTGLHGLGGIQYKRDNIIRPLLGRSRQEIEVYCKAHQLSPRIDQTNLEPVYHRNKIRLELIPLLEEQYNPKLVEALGRTAQMFSYDREFIDQEAALVYDQVREKEAPDVVMFSVDQLTCLSFSILSRILRMGIEEIMGKGDNIEFKHVEQLIDLIKNKGTGKQLHLPMGVIALISYDTLILTTRTGAEEGKFCYGVEGLETVFVPEIQATFEFTVHDKEKLSQIPRDNYIKAFDYDKITAGLSIRNRNMGDKFAPMGASGSKKLKDFFIDQKIEREKRDRIPLLCDGDNIMWVVGYRMSEIYKISLKTKRVLLVKYFNTSK